MCGRGVSGWVSETEELASVPTGELFAGEVVIPAGYCELVSDWRVRLPWWGYMADRDHKVTLSNPS